MTALAPHRRRFRAPGNIFWAAFALRVACILIGHTYKIKADADHFTYGFEAARIARSLVHGHGYGNPFNGLSGPTAWLPPLYPLLIALAFKLFGIYTRGAAFFLLVCNSLFSAAVAPAVYEIAARCFDANGFARRSSSKVEPVALWSAWMWAIYPAALQYAIHWIWEMSLSTCLFTWTIVFALRLRRIGASPAHEAVDARPSLLWAGFGLLWGLTALSNATLLLVLPVSALWILWPDLTHPPSRATLIQPLRAAALACAVFLVTLGPWVARNERALHAFVPTRANFGIELWQSAHFYWRGFPWGSAMSLWPGDPEFQRYVRLGEVRYAQEKGVQAVSTLRAHPVLLARNTAYRIYFFWFGVPHPSEGKVAGEITRTVNYGFLSVAGLLGLGLALRQRAPGTWLFALVFLLMPLPYYLVTVQARFRHPMEPLIAVLAVYLFRSTSSRSAPSSFEQRKAPA